MSSTLSRRSVLNIIAGIGVDFGTGEYKRKGIRQNKGTCSVGYAWKLKNLESKELIWLALKRPILKSMV
jgi:hypothetical protein